MIMAKMTERDFSWQKVFKCRVIVLKIRDLNAEQNNCDFFPTIEQLYSEDHLTNFTFQTFPEFASALQYIIF